MNRGVYHRMKCASGNDNFFPKTNGTSLIAENKGLKPLPASCACSGAVNLFQSPASLFRFGFRFVLLSEQLVEAFVIFALAESLFELRLVGRRRRTGCRRGLGLGLSLGELGEHFEGL
eukprot:GHVT01006311.1.p1 GENE.GHVT01006311.1~~GHVT01006311.1.p1  ORF type:complete len:118 (-),score=10.37 GHVT01006311.1:918-1271(-)